ncbi:MaoC/PaaZ C-terminal domain-containing protein [Hydrogenophaga palleronii]|uniref:MaoC/PaaZ C-terminal domain-containing protein n=1 Tax=Hydrogenophaga palleronii TaxID=65655 RepID=UPI000826C9DB|nr:MaoC/PaaZ C-terminal domain-containing protein [Hydrogenophaga palleronii]
MLDYHRLKATRFEDISQTNDADATILYALGVGAGLGGEGGLGDETEFLYEEVLRALPTQASVLAYPGFWMRSPEHGIVWQQVVHGEQRMHFPGHLAPTGQVRCRMEVSHVADKGEGKGAIVLTRRILSDAITQMPVAIIEQSNVCRGDGGYAGGDPALSDAMPPPISSPPAREPDHTVRVPTSAQQAALYRLNADRNPLHIDPAAARRAGYDRPILHGAALLGMVDRVLQHELRQHQDHRLGELNMRFRAPLFPGETVAVALWRTPSGVIFRCRCEQDQRDLATGSANWIQMEHHDAR